MFSPKKFYITFENKMNKLNVWNDGHKHFFFLSSVSLVEFAFHSVL